MLQLSIIRLRSIEELQASRLHYDAVSINYLPNNVDGMIDLLKDFDFDSKQFHRPDLTLAHTRKAAVFGHGDDKPLLITASESECTVDKIFMMNEVLKVADCERVKHLCVLQFVDLPAHELVINLKNCLRALRQSQYWTNIQNIDVYVSSKNYSQARDIYNGVMNSL